MHLSKEEKSEFVESNPGWTLDGETISRTYAFQGFPDAIAFVTRISFAAEEADHHPDIDIRWNKVRIALTTHSEKALTQKDVDLAGEIDVLAGA